MTAQNINLRSIIDDEVLQSRFYHDDTILDLRKRFAKEQGYDDDYENITFYRFCNELPDEKLVRELAEAEGGISYKIAPCLKVVSNEDIFVVWGTTRAEINLLTKEEVLSHSQKSSEKLGHFLAVLVEASFKQDQNLKTNPNTPRR